MHQWRRAWLVIWVLGINLIWLRWVEKSWSLKTVPQWWAPGNTLQQSFPCWFSWFNCLPIIGEFLNAFVNQWEILGFVPTVSSPLTWLLGEAWNWDPRLTWKFKHQKTREANNYSTVLSSGDMSVACCRAMPWLSLCPRPRSFGNGKGTCWPCLVRRGWATDGLVQGGQCVCYVTSTRRLCIHCSSLYKEKKQGIC